MTTIYHCIYHCHTCNIGRQGVRRTEAHWTLGQRSQLWESRQSLPLSENTERKPKDRWWRKTCRRRKLRCWLFGKEIPFRWLSWIPYYLELNNCLIGQKPEVHVKFFSIYFDSPEYLKITIQVCPRMTQAMLSDLRPCIVGMVSAPTELSQMVFMFSLTENDTRIFCQIAERTQSNK